MGITGRRGFGFGGAVAFAIAALLLTLVLGHGVAAADENPAAACGEDNIYVRVTTWRGETIVRELPIATRGGCASSWATGQMSVAAVAGQCKRLEQGFVTPAGPVQITYPHTFYGLWTADTRADCIKILHGLATGELDADVLPFPY